jgi:signal transduction histidine kinase/ActR/RegA family two-component response regulator
VPASELNLFDPDTWSTALEKYGAATGLTVTIYAIDGRIACGPVHSTPLFDLFARHGYEPGILAECARRCLTQVGARPAVVVAPEYGLGVVGTSLLLEDVIVGAAIAGYTLIDFSQSSAIEQLAREAGVPLRDLWDIARTHQPMPERRLLVQGDLLQVLGDAILRENYRTRQLTDESAAKDDFLAMLSHELRTPLTPIRAWAAVLKLGPHDAARSLRAAEVIERNAVLQTRLVDDLLELNRASRGTSALVLRVHDLAEIVRSATETILPDALERGITLELQDPRGSLFAEVDRDRVEQIIRNVLSNAVKFTPERGRIKVHVASDGHSATVTVSDTGDGIAAEFLPFAFDQFRQEQRRTRGEHSGLGIGLALVKQLTELHGGHVTIASGGVGLGTEVTIGLPLTSAVGIVQPPPPTGELPDLTGRRLLVVDDQQDTRVVLQLLLGDAGADVQLASEGIEALKLAQEGEFDVVLCDLRMPIMDGYEFIRALRQARPGDAPPVIATSGFASSLDHVRTVAAGFVGHVDKAFDLRRLAAALETAIRARNDLAPPTRREA